MDDELRTFLRNRNLAEELIAKLEDENVRHTKNKPAHI